MEQESVSVMEAEKFTKKVLLAWRSGHRICLSNWRSHFESHFPNIEICWDRIKKRHLDQAFRCFVPWNFGLTLPMVGGTKCTLVLACNITEAICTLSTLRHSCTKSPTTTFLFYEETEAEWSSCPPPEVSIVVSNPHHGAIFYVLTFQCCCMRLKMHCYLVSH
jgi:hypothetical protein